MEPLKDLVLPIDGKVQHYAWGGYHYIPDLLNSGKKEGEPYAEYWLGTHDRGSAEYRREGEDPVLLKDYISAFPELTLGPQAARRFGRLPYLLKVLDVKDMLSIQVHPNLLEARTAFKEENLKGIPLDAPERNYKDDNHKPELVLALSEFWLLHGFKPAEPLRQILNWTPELQWLLPVFGDGNYRELYRTVMEMSEEQTDRCLQPLLQRIVPLYRAGKLQKTNEDFWAARAAVTYADSGHTDRGIFSVYFFNLVQLKPGEAVFQDAGLPHAYLEGQNVEIMANSDNVLRGGLTPKHIDVPELLKHIQFQATVPQIIHGRKTADGAEIFQTTAPDFELSRFDLPEGETLSLTSRSVEIFILLQGTLNIQEDGKKSFGRSRGQAWISFDAAVSLITAGENAIFYRASIPVAP